MNQHEQDKADASMRRIDNYKSEVGANRATDINEAADLIGDALCAWEQSHKWGVYINIDPGALAVAALSRVRAEKAELWARAAADRRR